MKRVAGVVLAVVLVCGVLGVRAGAAAGGRETPPPGWAEACSHDNVSEHNKHCEPSAAAGPTATPPSRPAPANGSGPTMAERAADCGADRDHDGNPWPDGCDLADGDADGVPNQFDNCVSRPNNDQRDVDGDGIGDRCDAYPDDSDHDGVADGRDNCASDPNGAQSDGDGDGIGDACDSDQGNNGRPDSVDAAYADVYDTAIAATDAVVGLIPTP